ncbi:cyclin, putative [Eimeria praecox]|uniref:Cyclin, putative n=1 Tax=Eimeria praecox TaxID=51316 RepID=U6H5X5_9EIME|nr:cyclin, putative [Eimeria praecox]
MVERTDVCYEYKGTRVLYAVVPGPNGIPVSPEWEKKMIGGGRPVRIEVTETEEYPRTVEAQLEVEATRDKIEEMRRVENGLCRREAEGTDESDYPTDEIVVRPWECEASELADSNQGAIMCNLGTTVVSNKLRPHVNETWDELTVARSCVERQKRDDTKRMHQKTPAEQTYAIIISRQVEGMSAEEVGAILRPPHLSGTGPREGKVKSTDRLFSSAGWIGFRPPPVSQITNQANNNSVADGDEAESPRAEAQFGYFQSEEWMLTAEEQWISGEILELLWDTGSLLISAEEAADSPASAAITKVADGSSVTFVTMATQIVLVPRKLQQRTPSIRDGLSRELEISQRIYGCHLIQRAGILLRLEAVTVASAQTILHRFYYRKSLKKFDVRLVATSSLLLACKLEEDPRRTLVHPHRYILQYIHALCKGDYIPTNRLSQIAWGYLNDSMRTTLCCEVQPAVVAVGSIFLAACDLNIHLAKETGWYELFDVTWEDVLKVCTRILSLYKREPPKYTKLAESRTPPPAKPESALTDTKTDKTEDKGQAPAAPSSAASGSESAPATEAGASAAAATATTAAAAAAAGTTAAGTSSSGAAQVETDRNDEEEMQVEAPEEEKTQETGKEGNTAARETDTKGGEDTEQQRQTDGPEAPHAAAAVARDEGSSHRHEPREGASSDRRSTKEDRGPRESVQDSRESRHRSRAADSYRSKKRDCYVHSYLPPL